MFSVFRGGVIKIYSVKVSYLSTPSDLYLKHILLKE